MTTIVYSDGILAADTRFTSTRQARGEHKCIKCDHLGGMTVGKCKKVVKSVGKKYNGETIVAMSGAGLGTSIDKAIEIFNKEENVVEIIRIHKLFKQGNPFGCCRIMMVTDKAVYVHEFDSSEYFVEKHELTETVAIGSGAMAALLSIKLFGWTSIDAVMAASVVDKSTGGHVDYINYKDGTEINSTTEIDKEAFLIKVKNDYVTQPKKSKPKVK